MTGEIFGRPKYIRHNDYVISVSSILGCLRVSYHSNSTSFSIAVNYHLFSKQLRGTKHGQHKKFLQKAGSTGPYQCSVGSRNSLFCGWLQRLGGSIQVCQRIHQSHTISWRTRLHTSPKRLGETCAGQTWWSGMGTPLLKIRRTSYLPDLAALIMTCQRKHYNSVTDTIQIRMMPSEYQNCHEEWIRHDQTRWQVEGLLTWAETRERHRWSQQVKVFLSGFSDWWLTYLWYHSTDVWECSICRFQQGAWSRNESRQPASSHIGYRIGLAESLIRLHEEVRP